MGEEKRAQLGVKWLLWLVLLQVLSKERSQKIINIFFFNILVKMH